MLLKTPEAKDKGLVVDPCNYPKWVIDRYISAGIALLQIAAEDYRPSLEKKVYDEVWIYNCLQHVKDPEQIIKNCKGFADRVRIFEWIDHPVNEMHPHMLTEEKLLEWLKPSEAFQTDKTSVYGVKDLNEMGAVGKCFYGVFSY